MPIDERVRTGACLCKQITFRVSGDELNFAICHCTNCRRHCGTTYTANAWFPDAVSHHHSKLYQRIANSSQQFKWTSGEQLLKQYDDRATETGEIVHRSFCTNCGSPMLTTSPRMPGISIVPSGLFDGEQTWRPSYEQWRRSKVSFVDPIRAVKNESRYDEHPDLREFEKIWSKSGARPAQEFIDR